MGEVEIMLVDPKMRADNDIGVPKEILAIIDRQNIGIIRLGQGLYQCGHWNFHTLCTNALEEYPQFCRSIAAYIEKLNTSEDRQNDRFFQRQVQAARRLPENLETLYRSENWKYPEQTYLDSYGVCDSPEQLLTLYDFEADPRKLCISFVKIERAQEPSSGGWRWHKWGAYVGMKDPQHEYLAHEPDIEAVCTYHIYEIL